MICHNASLNLIYGFLSMPGLLSASPTARLLGLDLAAAPLGEVAAALAGRDARERFEYVVTPNADHFVRLRDGGPALRELYDAAGALLLDSRVVGRTARMLRLDPPPVVSGSDLTFELFDRHIAPGDALTVVGTTTEAVAALRTRYRLAAVAHHCPPFGFEREPALVEQCADFVEANPARFVFLACGAPRQEILARRILERGRATGIGLCIGAAIDQIGGHERRAPAWIRDAGLEWGWRITREPRRLGRRYLTDTRIFVLLLAEARRRR